MEKSKGKSKAGTAPQGKDEVCIPKDLDDCFVQLNKILTPADIQKLKDTTEDNISLYHFGIGMWMRNSWGLWRDSRLAKWFNAQGIHHPDDMSAIILVSFWHYLNDRPVKLVEQVRHYQDFWEKRAVQPEDKGHKQ